MYYITYDNETVVYNSDHKQLVKCPGTRSERIYTRQLINYCNL